MERSRSIRWLAAELVVVVLGIVIAFQLDSWRLDRLDRASEKTALEAVLHDLEGDSAGLVAFLEAVRARERASRRLGLHFAGRAPLEADSLRLHFLWATIGRIWEATAPAYQGLRDSGQLALISEAEVRAALVDYYDHYVYELIRPLGDIPSHPEFRARLGALGRMTLFVGGADRDGAGEQRGGAPDRPGAPGLAVNVREGGERWVS